jgi:hypothetical protein
MEERSLNTHSKSARDMNADNLADDSAKNENKNIMKKNENKYQIIVPLIKNIGTLIKMIRKMINNIDSMMWNIGSVMKIIGIYVCVFGIPVFITGWLIYALVRIYH